MHSTAIAERIVTKKLSCPNFTKDNKRVLGCSSFWLEIVLDGQLSSVSGDCLRDGRATFVALTRSSYKVFLRSATLTRSFAVCYGGASSG